MDYSDHNSEKNFEEAHTSYESYANVISSSLEGVNNYTKRRGELPSLLLYFLHSNGESYYKDINIRELYSYILKSINELEKSFEDKKKREKILLRLNKKNSKKKKRRNSFDDIYHSNTHTIQSPVSSPRAIHKKKTFSRSPTASRPNTTNLPTFSDSDGEYDSNGKEDSEDESESDSELEYYTDIISDIRLKDLRRLDYQFNSDEEKSIIVKKHCVLFAMDPLRAIVMSDVVILVVPAGADSLISMLEQSMRYWRSEEEEILGIEEEVEQSPEVSQDRKVDVTQSLKIPFVLHAYESLLTTLKSLEDNRFDHINSQIQHVLSLVRSGSLIPLRVQEKLRNLKNDLSDLKNNITSTRQILTNITEDEEEMALMNLYLLQKNPDLYKANESESTDNKIYNGSILTMSPQLLESHDEIEELLESYLFDFNALDLKINYTRSQIQSAEEGVSSFFFNFFLFSHFFFF